MKRNPFEILFGIVLTVCLCVAAIIHQYDKEARL